MDVRYGNNGVIMNNNELNNYLAIADQEFLDKNIKIDRDEGKISIHIVGMFEKVYNESVKIFV